MDIRQFMKRKASR